MGAPSFDKYLRVRSTGNVSLKVLATTFNDGIWKEQARIDESQFFHKSFGAPSFVQLVAALPWWGQLGISAAGIVATGYLKEAGSSLWKRQPALAKLVSERLWSLASKIVALQPLISSNTKIDVGFPLGNEYFPAVLTLTDLSVDGVAFQIAALCFHQPAIEEFVGSPDFDPALGSFMELQQDGTIVLNWQQIGSLEKRSRAFPI